MIINGKKEPRTVSNMATLTTNNNDNNNILAERQRLLIRRLKEIPHQAMSLRRNKYRVIRRITKYV